jgi:hypothetical protein
MITPILLKNRIYLYEIAFKMNILRTLRFSKGAPKQDQLDCNFVLLYLFISFYLINARYKVK